MSRRIPTQLHKLHGNPGERALPKHEPIPVGDLTEPPEHLSEGQKGSWRYVLANAPPGLLRRIDRGALTVWVVAEDLHRQATAAQNEAPGLLVPAKEGGALIQSGYLPIINRQAQIMLKAAGEMGFSPVSRPRIYGGSPGERPVTPITDEPPGSGGEIPLAEYLARPPSKVH